MRTNLLKYSSLLLLAILMSCQKESKNISELIIGRWDWVKKIIIILLVLVVTLPFIIALESCNKEVSNEINFIGVWRETRNTKVATIEFRSDNTVYFIDAYNPIHQYLYKIDEKLKFIYFSVDNNPEHDSKFAYSYDIMTKELTIWGLYISIPESPSKTIFIKD
jgi:hypothetical protein